MKTSVSFLALRDILIISCESIVGPFAVKIYLFILMPFIYRRSRPQFILKILKNFLKKRDFGEKTRKNVYFMSAFLGR